MTPSPSSNAQPSAPISQWTTDRDISGSRPFSLRKLRVQNDRCVPSDRLLDRLARDQQEANPLVAGLNRDLIAAIEQHQRSIAGFLAHHDLVAVDFLLGEHTERLRGRAERAGALEHI